MNRIFSKYSDNSETYHFIKRMTMRKQVLLNVDEN